MNKEYIRYIIKVSSEEEKDILVAILSDFGIDGFEEVGALLYASGCKSTIEENEIEDYLRGQNITFEKSIIAGQNWNAVWESNFEPVKVGDFVGVRADFHAPLFGVAYEIVITPKMSFGTGHHATTYLMMQLMRDIAFKNARVFDFGTGTGILSILAEKLGAGYVEAVDYDDWCILNAAENIERNACTKIVLEKGEKPSAKGNFEMVLANINKNIILQYLDQLVALCIVNGCLILSGLLVADEADIVDASKKYKLILNRRAEKSGWIALFFIKPVY